MRNAGVDAGGFERGEDPRASREGAGRGAGRDPYGGKHVTRALRSHGLWLTLTYLGLILLMARAYG